MRVAAVQYKAPKGDKEQALRELAHLAERAAPNQDLVVFPEMAATGYLFDSPEDVETVAEESSGPTLAALAPIARANGTWMVIGFPERAEEGFYNAALVIDRTGSLVFTYRKTLLYDADLPWALPGNSGYRAFDTGAGRFGVGICMDLNDDAFVAWCAREKLRVAALPTNWIHEEDALYDVWTYWALRMAHARETALIAANTYGSERDTVFCGKSAVLDRFTVLDAAEAAGKEIVRATLS